MGGRAGGLTRRLRWLQGLEHIPLTFTRTPHA